MLPRDFSDRKSISGKLVYQHDGGTVYSRFRMADTAIRLAQTHRFDRIKHPLVEGDISSAFLTLRWGVTADAPSEMNLTFAGMT